MKNLPDKKKNEDRKVHVRRKHKWLTWGIVAVTLLAGLTILLPQFALLKAKQAIEKREHESAQWWLTVARILPPQSAEWHFLSAIIHRRLNNFPGVETELKTAHELGWPLSELERQQRIAQAQTGQFHEIENHWGELFTTAGSDGPEICGAYLNYCLARFRFKEAATAISMWKADFPKDPGPYLAEATITAVLQKWNETEKLLRKAIELDPNPADARIRLAESLVEQQKFSDAESQLRTALNNSSSAQVFALFAHSLAQQGRAKEASNVLKEALKQHPENLELLSEYGRLQLMQGDSAGAADTLRIVIDQQPENTELRYSYAQALRNMGKETEATQHFKMVDEGTRAMLELGQLTSDVIDHPNDVEKRFRVASITWHWKSRRSGLAWLRSVLEFDPHHRETHELLARHYELTGETVKANHHKQQAEIVRNP